MRRLRRDSIGVAMSWTVFKIVAKAKSVPEVAIVIRILLGLVGGFVLLPVATSLLDPAELTASDYVGLLVFTAAGLWLLRAALRGR